MGRTTEKRSKRVKLKIAIAVSQFNSSITQKLVKGALRSLRDSGVDEENIDVLWVPGAFELTQAVRALAGTGRFDGILPLGCVIRGETPHFDYICQSVTWGLTQLALELDVPIAFGILTTNTIKQASARAGSKANKGSEAAKSLMELIGVLRELRK